jgi:hypothetical protein
MASKGLSLLKELALADSFEKHPNLPDYVRYVRRYSDKTANELQLCIIHFLTFSGHQAERIAVTGRYLDNSKVITDVIGSKRKIGSGKWIPGSMQPGSADISATIAGKSVKIEVKMKDRQSPAQKKYQAQIEKAGGIYLIVRSFDEFLTYYNEII